MLSQHADCDLRLYKNQAWWPTFVVLALGIRRQGDQKFSVTPPHTESEPSLDSLRPCIGYFLISVIKYPDKSRLREGRLISPDSFREILSTGDEKTWRLTGKT